MRRLVFALSMLAACGGKDTSVDTPMDAPAITGQKFELHWGPVTVAPAQENTQCVVLKLSNTTPIKVHQIHNILGPGSHHVIVYRDDLDTAEMTTPYNCQPFTGALNTTGSVFPMMITQKLDDLLTLPDGVGYTLAANQMIRIEMHYINTGDQPITAMETTEFYAADEATIHDEANILFIGTPDINLAPDPQPVSINEFFAPSRANLDLSTAKFFAITGHTHKLGTDVQVNTAPTNGGTKTSVYNPQPFVWSEPETTVHSPEFMVPAGGGFDFTCTYSNTTGTTVKFGESANNEMCFFWAYYYPSKGSHVCVHSNNYGNVDLCCPDAGATLCNRITGM